MRLLFSFYSEMVSYLVLECQDIVVGQRTIQGYRGNRTGKAEQVKEYIGSKESEPVVDDNRF